MTLTPEILAFTMLIFTLIILMMGYPVAFTLAGSAVLFAGLGITLDLFNVAYLNFYPLRVFGQMKNETLVAIPLFIFMGTILESTKIAANLLLTLARLFGKRSGGLGISVILVGALLAASSGIVGATVVMMGMMALPLMQTAGYDNRLATGIICASGTLGQVIPPSIVLILLGGVMQGANEDAASAQGILVPEPITIIDLFAGALVPGLLLVLLYISWVVFQAIRNPQSCPPIVVAGMGSVSIGEIFRVVLPPLLLIFIVLGSILIGAATATESAALGVVGTVCLAATARKLKWSVLSKAAKTTIITTSMVFFIILGAQLFSLVFRGFGGDAVIEEFLQNLPGGRYSAFLIVMLVLFLLGFFLDFFEIIFMVVPIVAPSLIMLGFDPLWLGVMITINLQTSFLTPPFGFALFYLGEVAKKTVTTAEIWRGVVPFIALQLLALALLGYWPGLVLWLPDMILQ